MINFVAVLEMESNTRSTVDDALIQGIASGNEAALHKLYECAYESIYGFSLSIVKNTYDAEDVLQETFLTIYRNAPGYLPKGKPMAWIFTIARNLSLMKLRERQKTCMLEENQVEHSTAFTQIETVEQRLVLQTALCALQEEERQILMLHVLGGLKNREIAAVLEIPMNTVLSKYHRVVKKMRKALEEEGFGV